MGCAPSSVASADPEAAARSSAIDAEIKASARAASQTVKMLLLGAGESGKSTVLKQMKLIHAGGYQEDESAEYKEIIFSNTVQSMRVLIEGLRTMEIPIAAHNRHHAETVLAAPSQIEGSVMPRALAEAVGALWADPGIRRGFERRSEMQLNDSAEYFFSILPEMSSPSYRPTDMDILRARVKTTGITETTFRIGELTYKLFDVGGQRSERKKWIHCFEDVGVVLFLVAISEFDQRLYEDENVNRMQEALMLFDSIVNSRWFLRSSVILFLNKIDIFRVKIKSRALADYFPNYQGDNDFASASTFIQDQFLNLNQNPQKRIYSHFTSALDTDQMRFVLAAINDSIVTNRLKASGLL